MINDLFISRLRTIVENSSAYNPDLFYSYNCSNPNAGIEIRILQEEITIWTPIVNAALDLEVELTNKGLSVWNPDNGANHIMIRMDGFALILFTMDEEEFQVWRRLN